MKRVCFALCFIFYSAWSIAQVVTTNPVNFPRADQTLTITVDVSGTSLDHYAWDNNTSPVYIWAWYQKDGASIDAPTNIDPATTAQASAKCTRISTNPDKYQFVMTPIIFMNAQVSDLTAIGIKLKTKAWADNKQTDNDRYITLSQGFDLIFTQPTTTSFFANSGDQLSVSVVVSQTANITLKIDGVQVGSASQQTVLNYSQTITESSGTSVVTCQATDGTDSKTISFTYTIRTSTVQAPRPPGIIDGINYQADPTKVTLSLWAPLKSSVYVIGEFNNWQIDAAYQMKQDGEHFWLEVDGLTSGVEYAFHYLVDETLWIADPYADKILDTDDQFIPAATYPNLKPYPAQAVNQEWYFNRLAVLQTNQTPYVWQATGYQRPQAEKLVIYELLVRDFFASNGRNYQNLIDTISYFKRLGINAIELMPIMEFNGNDSWGYNPTFMFAPDKYYGTKDKLKEFIDTCHKNGIAVILDIVMNHQDIPNSYALMYYDFVNSRPAPNNPWFNVVAPHPYSVFNDLNHESPYTQKYLDTVNYHWLNDYKADGLRFDLSKGFTQTVSDVNTVGNYDASRIAILERMADVIWSKTPDSYIILEHFAANDEETVLANYRSAEGKAMMLWENFNYAYNQSTMGFGSGSDFSAIFYGNKGWAKPHEISYMESHDEERLMYNNLQFGNSSGSYNVKTLTTGLKRIKEAATFFYTIPGPKMEWEFGELGYDFSINTCADLTVNTNGSCRLTDKPVKWTYENDANRKLLFNHIADLIRLRNTYAIFQTTDVTVSGGENIFKEITLKNSPFNTSPTTTDEMNVQIAGNFDVTPHTTSVHFSHTGDWYDYYFGGARINVSTTPFTVNMEPGEFHLYTDVAIEAVTGIEEEPVEIFAYPNPTSGIFAISGIDQTQTLSVELRNSLGQHIPLSSVSENQFDFRSSPEGVYLLQIKSGAKLKVVKIIKAN